ncbi:MAG: type III polyketide synthase [Planctomycetota bacterium]|jgi:predicted naringenin-chalcone synthase
MSIPDSIVGFRPPGLGPRMISTGTANPPDRYTQEEVLALFGETRPIATRLFKSVNINTRHLYLPEPVEGRVPEETNEDLYNKHKRGMLELGPKAIEECLTPVGLAPFDIDFLCCISSTGFLCPGITAHLTKKMGFRENVHRVDVLGMGCNAGLNGLQPVVNFARANPGKLGLAVCVEICSAMYIYDEDVTTAVVNSLFGDGVAAAVIRQDKNDVWKRGPIVVDFESHIVTEALEAMRIDLDGNKYSFRLTRDIPYVIGANIKKPLQRLLGRTGLRGRHINHWIIHGGGRKVIDAIMYNVGITNQDMRHTHSILHNFGNVSSGSFIFSLQELFRERIIKEGDLGVIITMGPGTSIEMALLSWS